MGDTTPDKARHDWYINEHKSLVEGQRSQYNEFDKNLLLLSGGSFGLSFAFIKQFVPTVITDKWMLILSWSLYCGSIAVTVLSFLISQHAYEKQMKILKLLYETGGVPEQNSFGNLVVITNWISFAMFLSATFLQISFVASNY